ncbi:hypothetical protein [Flavobacterium poyangense]|uniref:hypothetical protein n=1 Tax=Flavobacterium poyangense TaxID=2204302 RepID=UPI0014227807|nr:hypothetical protein [Flavobacterium sp. JXAS1]
MKANKPSLILFFLALFFTIIFGWTGQDFLVIYTKSIVLPAIFIYFLISSDFRIGKIESLIFLFCFIGQIFEIMAIEISEVGGVVSFLIVYLLLLLIFVREHEKLKLTRKDVLPIAIIIIFLVYLLVSILNMQFYNMKRFIILYTIYGIVLGFVSYFCFASYITKGTHIALLMSLMAISYMFSDIFYVFNEYFSYSVVLGLIRDTTQILAYYFMVEYFLEKIKVQKKMRSH